MNAIASATSGLQWASARFGAASIGAIQAVSGPSPGDPASSIVDQIGAKAQFTASAKVLSTADAMTRTLLDITV